MLRKLLQSTDERALSFQSIFAAGADLAPTTAAGTVITASTALKIGAVYASVRLLSDTISTLPWDAYQTIDGNREPLRPRPVWMVEPMPGITWQDHLGQVMFSLTVDGNSFTRIYRNNTGAVVALSVLNPRNVDVKQDPSGAKYYLYDNRIRLEAAEVTHLQEMPEPGSLRSKSRIDEAKETLGLAAALTEFSARFFGSGSVTSGIIEAPSIITEEQAKTLKSTFEKSHRGIRNSNRVGILGGGAKYVKTSVDNDEAQMLESRHFAVEEIARLFRIPVHMLQVTTPGAMSYASTEQNAIQFASYTLRPYLSKIEHAYSMLIPGEGYVRANLNGLLRGDMQTQFSSYSTGMQAGYLAVNDVRRLMDMPPVEGGDQYRVPLANVNVDAANIVEQEKRVNMLSKLVIMGFDPTSALQAVGLPDITHTGLPSVQLQGIAQIDPENPEDAYEVG